MWDFNVRRRLGESAKKKKKKGGTRVGTKTVYIDRFGSAQDISEIRTGSSSRVSYVPSRDGLV